MKRIDIKEFLRSFTVRPNGALNVFLGAGASVQAGIPTAGMLIWQFKRMLYCQANNIKEEKFKDLESERNQNTIQSYFDLKGGYPERYSQEEYSAYFEHCFPKSIDRKYFMQKIVEGRNPSIGHKCLGALFDCKKVNHIWTTNFDELIENGIKSVNNASSFEVISIDNQRQLANLNNYPRVVKLHGDYRYDKLQNTVDELQTLEKDLHKYFADVQSKTGLIVIGYGGNDQSIMSAFEKTLEADNPFPFGLYWCVRTGQKTNKKVIEFIEKVHQKNKEKLAAFIEIDSFDDFLYELYKTNNLANDHIENIAKSRFEKRKAFTAPQIGTSFTPIKLNAIKAKTYPKSIYSFKTDLKGGKDDWDKLREIIKDQPVSAALTNENTVAFASVNDIKKLFSHTLKSEITTVDIDDKLIYRQESFYLGMLYDLIEHNLLKKFKLEKVPNNRLRKYYSKNYKLNTEELQKSKIKTSLSVYEAFEIQIEFHNKELFLIILPSIHIDDKAGLSRFEKQEIANKIISKRWNRMVNNQLRFWLGLLKNDNTNIEFSIDSFKIDLEEKFSGVGSFTSSYYIFKGAFISNEPKLSFHISDSNYKTVHPLKGLKNFGPLDYSFESKQTNQQAIKLGIITPISGMQRILKHLNELNNEIRAATEKEYLTDYYPFSNIYKRYLDIPQNKDSKFLELVNEAEVNKLNHLEFYDFLKRKIDYFYTIRGEFDVLVLYFPKGWTKFRELKNDSVYFDLHDSIKLYCAKKNIKIQFVEDKSIDYLDPAKVKWWLSLGLYVKANGLPWRNVVVNESTAFVGLDFAVQRINNSNKYVLGSSQIFDSSGQGLRFLLQPIEHPVFIGKNPFMSKEDARRMILKLKEAYFRIDGNSKLEKLVVHKVLHYTNDEMTGISEALEGIENIELLQIQKYSKWRAIRGDIDRYTGKVKTDPHNFPIQRGTVIQLDDFSFLLWTHGSVQEDDVAGRHMNYYQGKRGIPAPLLIRRFRGTDPIEMTVRDILSLTKMNWNGGELYKTLPVTLDFSKRLSKYAKQAETLQAIPYDFRFFM
ncbi:MAG: hypothetical protein DYG83_06440 [Candidatus Brocadia sp. AMX2]|uniref:SIR2 family protein n=1 Tax=Candidatus Brocadia sp. AMX2 TaxID=2293635 RepID=UPI000EDE2D37|nr:SIR2 family protein [Candidatus Brocadia sp. AMX2]MBC6932464.1 hypothetical protein [Candidatus Brocadia sp.]KAA0245143.1 MAG: hypothetical protein EDM70_03735 [Candidatus Brocadia sp. AMX2]MCE7866457.1 hypothetical protein [Candidatus Brocadia sp. AMX2]MCQ3917240.1 hypothetical protein [Candidatus Brocadia sp.]MDL1935484.1 hypothetical protein [Candidatus Brocadia sp. AMX2]